MQISGIEKIAPIYYLFAIAAGDASTTNSKVAPEVAEAVLPAILLAYALPGALMALVPLTATEVSRSTFTPQTLVTYAFFLAPVAVPLFTTAISQAVRWLRRDKDGLKTGKADDKTKKALKSDDETSNHLSTGVPALRTAYAVTFAIQAAQHIYTLARAFLISSANRPLSFTASLGNLLTTPTIPGQLLLPSVALYAGATLGFGSYTVWDLRRRGYTTNLGAGRAALGVAVGQVLLGPGATFAGLWWWREGVLAGCAHRLGPSRRP